MLKIRNFFQNSGSIYFLCAVLSAAALINAVCGAGMIEDGVHHFWEAITRISTYYLLFVNTLLTVYYYPKLVIAKTRNETKLVFWSFYKQVLPLFVLGLTLIYIFRVFAIETLLTKEFEPVSDLFFWQLVGDFLKVASWILGLQFFAKKMTKAFILTEILSLVILYFSSFYFVSIFKTEGVVIAHAFTYFMYLLVLGIYFRKILV